MELVKPDIGLVFWMLFFFGIFFFILKKFAFPVITKALKDREQSIQEALDSAKRAREEMAGMQAENERILQEARNQRDVILKEARETKDMIVNEARAKAQTEADRLIGIARDAIQNEKMAAITELKNQMATLSIEIAEKMIRQHLSTDSRQKELVHDMLKEVELT
jgi:F-type H+-transporting ATPase subunit b